MSNLKDVFLKIYKKQKGLFALMIVLFLLGMFVLVYSILAINPDSAVVRVGYGDIGGYRDGAWTNLLTFPVLAVVFGFLHNFLAMRIFEKYGEGIAKMFIIVSLMLLFGTFIVFLRLLGES